jgi:hypothetical protein
VLLSLPPQLVKTRSLPQIRSYAQKFFLKWKWSSAEVPAATANQTVAAQQRLLETLAITVTGSEQCSFAGGAFVVYAVDVQQAQASGTPHSWTVMKR